MYKKRGVVCIIMSTGLEFVIDVCFMTNINSIKYIAYLFIYLFANQTQTIELLFCTIYIFDNNMYIFDKRLKNSRSSIFSVFGIFSFF